MTSLSWIIYGISALTSFQKIFSGLGDFFILTGLISSVGICAAWMANNSSEIRVDTFKQMRSLYMLIFVKIGIPVVLCSWLVSIVIPSKQTMVMIAAAEVGDKIFKERNVAGEIIDPSVDLLKTWIQTELQNQKDALNAMKNEGKKAIKDAAEKAAKKAVEEVLPDSKKGE